MNLTKQNKQTNAGTHSFSCKLFAEISNIHLPKYHEDKSFIWYSILFSQSNTLLLI